MNVPGLSVHCSDKLPQEAPPEKNSSPSAQSIDSGIKANLPVQTGSLSDRQRPLEPAPGSVPAAVAGLCRALGLPPDRLSHSIISFARFFSLPLDSGALSSIRSAIFSAQSSRLPAGMAAPADEGAGGLSELGKGFPGTGIQGSGAAPTMKSREALALAALAAADKGVNLNPDARDEYVAAIDPEQQGQQGQQENPEQQEHQKQQENPEQPEKSSPGDVSDKLPPQPEAVTSSSASPQGLKEQFIESAGKSPVQELLNRLPGRNGQRWLVFPLSFAENGFFYRISLRILLDYDSRGRYPVNRMSLDIVKSRESRAEQRWLFIFDAGSKLVEDEGGDKEKYRLTLLLQPSQPQGRMKALTRKLSGFLGIPAGNIIIENYRDSDFAPDCRNDVLPSINKEV